MLKEEHRLRVFKNTVLTGISELLNINWMTISGMMMDEECRPHRRDENEYKTAVENR
jgi:hypothetical protein